MIKTTLTTRQREVLLLILTDHCNKQIATKLRIQLRTAKYHVSAILLKFGASNRTGLILKFGHFEVRWVPNELATKLGISP